MKIKDIIKLSATYLNREDVLSYLEGNTQTVDENILFQIDTFTRCANVIISELASTYFPLYTTEDFCTNNKKVYYKDLSERVLSIEGVLDVNGKNYDYTHFVEYFKTELSQGVVKYRYLPNNYGLEDEIGYSEKDVAVRVLCFGTLGEFCLTERRFDESVMWRNRFTEEIASILAPKNAVVKQRRFL